MGRYQVPNKSYLRTLDPKLLQIIQSLEDAQNRVADQANVDPTGAQVAAPSQISGINVIASGGIHDIQIVDQSPAYRGVNYRADYSQTPDFQNFHTIDMGSSQNHRANLGSGTYYWRASSAYRASGVSPHVYHGGATPLPAGSGSYSGPAMQQQQGFTGQYRSSSTPPVRK